MPGKEKGGYVDQRSVTRAQWVAGTRRLSRAVAARDVDAVASLARSAASRLAGTPTVRRLRGPDHRGVDEAGVERPSISPVTNVPCPTLDLHLEANPVPAILAAPEFRGCVDFFASFDSAPRALVSPNTQALLHALVRNLDTEDVVEIGTYQASTTEAIARALLANGRGTVHTVDPFGSEVVPTLLDSWPPSLRSRVAFYAEDSMRFFAAAADRAIRPGLVFIDGNHDYEFALFDIEAAARIVRPGGFVAVDNIGQAGPFFAVCDFLDRHDGWAELGNSRGNLQLPYPFDPKRTAIENTDLCILRAPRRFSVGGRPITTGERVWAGGTDLSGLTASVARPVTGTLYVQCVLRSFGSPPAETTVDGRARFEDSAGDVTIHLSGRWSGSPAVRRTVEPWLVWDGEGVLEFAEAPRLC